MKVRRAALNRIGEHTIRTGAPMATIEEPLVPIFMYHRYAVESAASMVGGQDYIYAHARRRPHADQVGVGVDNQRKALDALATTLKPSELTVPKQVLGLIPPRPPGCGLHRELFPRTTGDSVRSARARHASRPTSPSASRCSSIARRAWWRSTPSTRRCRGSKKSSIA